MYFYVCSAPPGILVGHFTQLVWAQAWKIGCGRIVYKPEGKKRFENLFICNYGLAGRKHLLKPSAPRILQDFFQEFREGISSWKFLKN